MDKVYALYKNETQLRLFKNEWDAYEEAIYLQCEYPEYNYTVKEIEVF